MPQVQAVGSTFTLIHICRWAARKPLVAPALAAPPAALDTMGMPVGAKTGQPGNTLSHDGQHRRYNGVNPTKQRILAGTGSANQLSGFWGYTGLGTGVAHHQGWITNQVDRHGLNWVLSSNSLVLYRSNMVTRSTSTGSIGGTAFKWSINYSSCCGTQFSDWAMAVLLYYNRTLTLAEMQSMEVGGLYVTASGGTGATAAVSREIGCLGGSCITGWKAFHAPD